MAEIKVTKIEAARRQLCTAIELWFVDGDPVSTHALAFGAHQVVQDLMRRQNKTPQLAFDLSLFKPEHRTGIMDMLTEAGYFAKHADRGKASKLRRTVSFDPDLTRVFIAFTMSGLRYLNQDFSTEEMAFNLWHMVHAPDLLTDAGKNYFKDGEGVEMADALRSIPKNDFLQSIRRAVELRTARGLPTHRAPPDEVE